MNLDLKKKEINQELDTVQPWLFELGLSEAKALFKVIGWSQFFPI